MKKLIILIVYIIMSHLSKGQEWIRVFGEADHGKAWKVIEHYDYGYIIGGALIAENYSWYYGWIITTDINGDIIWGKKIGNNTGSYATGIYGLEGTKDGGFIISGATYKYDYGDIFIMKFNSCGEKEWCKIYNTPGNFDYAINVHQLYDEGYIVNCAYYGYNSAEKRIWLFRLDEAGYTLWKNLYATDTAYINEHAYNLIITVDSGYLLTGENWHEIDTLPGYYYHHPFYIKINSDGEQEWEFTYWPEQGFGNGVAKSSKCDTKGNIYSSGWRGNADEPTLIKLNKSGQPIFHKILMDSIYSGGTSTINFIQDSNIVLGGYHANIDNTGTTKIWKVDTIGNIILEKDSLIDNVDSPWDADITFDNKLVFIVTAPYTSQDNFDIIMYKINSDLEWDSVYTQSFEYDYLCPEPIVSDTIDMDCDIITDLEETINNPPPKLVIKPNPAKDKVIVELPEYYKTETKKNGITSTKIRYLKEMEKQLEVYDMMGRLVERVELPKGPTETQLDVSGWKKGLYFLRLVVGGLEAGTGKVVVE